MKNITKITGCALAAVLMTVAASAQAAQSNSSGKIVIDNTLYSPINFKVSVKYKDDNGNIKSASETSKDFLKDLGFNSDVMLCLGEDSHVYVVNKKSGQVIDESVSDEESTNVVTGMWVSTDEQIYSEKSSNKKSTYDSEGQITVDFTGTTSQFHLEGLYSLKQSSTSNEKKGNEKVNNSAKSMSLSGSANTEMGVNLPASGTASGSGSGTLVVAE